MPIFVDTRGDGEKDIARILGTLRYPVELRHIESGDYVFDNVGIERKTIQDLVGSVTGKEKGHNLWQQLAVLKDTYKKPLLLVEGFIDWDDRMVSSIIIGVTEGFGIPYINSVTRQQSAKIIGRIFDKYGVAKTKGLPPCAVKKGYTPQQIRWMMLQTIPKLGVVVAKKVLDANPHIFADTSKTYNLNISGLNKEAKDLLLKVLCPIKECTPTSQTLKSKQEQRLIR